MPWTEAIEQPGARQMQHARHLLESRPFLTRIPDDSILVADCVKTSPSPAPAAIGFSATRDVGGTYAMVYAPAGRPFRVRMNAIAGERVIARWFNPR